MLKWWIARENYEAKLDLFVSTPCFSSEKSVVSGTPTGTQPPLVNLTPLCGLFTLHMTTNDETTRFQ